MAHQGRATSWLITAINFGLCHERGETIAGLQDYVRVLEKALHDARP